ncbi:MAG TPA: hypothetical protein VJX70_09190 [Candidatus Acidoferrum sp.]|nr:hypothetical protein [Candidatus Acidoferrum sp.]
MAVRKLRILPKGKLKPLKAFDVSLIQRRLDGLLINVDRDLQRRLGSARITNNSNLFGQLTMATVMNRIAFNSYAALCFVTVDDEDYRRRKNFALIMPPVNRQLMDLLFTLVYIRDNFHARLLSYERASYRAWKEEYELYRGRFSGLPEWRSFFSFQKAFLPQIAKMLGITQAEKRNLNRIPRWKGPFKLSQEKTQSQPFLKWMVKWLYGETSAEAHLTGIGLFSISPFLLADLAEEEFRDVIMKRTVLQYHAKHFSRTVMLVLAIATELDAQFKLDNHTAIAYIWRILVEHAPDANDMYENRYKAMLT